MEIKFKSLIILLTETEPKVNMLYFIACHAPDIHGAKVADGLARVSISEKSPHLAFSSKELAQYYIDYRNATKICYLISEENITETIWHDFNDGIILFKSLKQIRKSLKNISYLFGIDQMAYTPALSLV